MPNQNVIKENLKTLEHVARAKEDARNWSPIIGPRCVECGEIITRGNLEFAKWDVTKCKCYLCQKLKVEGGRVVKK